MIVCVSGFIGSGKDTVADILIKNRSFEKLSLSSTLKDMVAILFSWDRKLLEGDTKESRIWREQIDEWWATRLQMSNLTPRWVLQNIGTNVLRDCFHKDIWLASIENKIKNISNKNIVISDCRFPNEIEFFKSLGATMIYISRNDSFSGTHASESSLSETAFDYYIENNGTIEDLEAKILTII